MLCYKYKLIILLCVFLFVYFFAEERWTFFSCVLFLSWKVC